MAGTADRRKHRRPGRSGRVPVEHDPYSLVAIRAFVEPPGWRIRSTAPQPTPRVGLFLHTVLSREDAEHLDFGVFAVVGPSLASLLGPDSSDALPEAEPIALGVFHPDKASPKRVRNLARDSKRLGLPPPIPRKEFLERFADLAIDDRAAAIGFNIAQEFGSLAAHWSRAARDPGRGGISQVLGTVPGEPSRKHPLYENGEMEDDEFPRLVSSAIDGVRAYVAWKPHKRAHGFRGVNVSLRALAEALSGRELPTLDAACSAFGIDRPRTADLDPLDAAVAEIRAECRLYRELLKRHMQLCPDQPPSSTASPGTYARALLRRTGLRPPLKRWPEFPREILAATSGAYFGGEVSLRVRGTKLPVRMLDFGGAFGIAASLIGACAFEAADEIDVVEMTPDEAREQLERFARVVREYSNGHARSPTPEEWMEIAFMTVFIEPRGELLPHRPKTGETWTAHRAPLTYEKGPLPLQAPDVVVQLLNGGELPEIVRAFRLVPRGRVGMREVELPTGRRVDPNTQDLFYELWVERGRVELDISRRPDERTNLRGLMKGMLNSLVSGLPIQLNDDEPTKEPREQIAFDPRTGKPEVRPVLTIEEPGEWCFPPLATAVTATARLVLHIAIESVRSLGGIVAYWDTDSVFVIAKSDGGLVPVSGGEEQTEDGREAVRALSFAEVEELRWRIESLLACPEDARPYEDVMGPDGYWARERRQRMLKLEPENRDGPCGFRTSLHAAIRAPKKYVPHRVEHVGAHVEIHDGSPVVVEPTATEAAIPHSLTVVGPSEHGLPFVAPDEHPNYVNEGYEHRLRLEYAMPTELPPGWGFPAISVVLAGRPDIADAHPRARPFAPLAVRYLPGVGPVVAPWRELFDHAAADWRDGDKRRVRMDYPGGPIGLTLGDGQMRAWNAFDPRLLDANGQPCGPRTEGVLMPAPTIVTEVVLIGKESRHLGVGRDVLTPPEFIEYGRDDPWPDFREAARRLSKDRTVRDRLLAASGSKDRGFDYWMQGARSPRRSTRTTLFPALAEEARRALRAFDAFGVLPDDDHGSVIAYLATPEPDPRCAGCGRPLAGNQRRWCADDACRKRFERTEQQRLFVE